MSLEENIATVRRYTEEGWEKQNLAVIDEVVAADMVNHDAIELMNQQHGAEEVKNTIRLIQRAFPGYVHAVEDLLAVGDKVVIRWTIRGTQQGPFLGIAPTGKAASWSGVNIFRLAGGKIVEEWGVVDIAGLLQQLGALPMPGPAS